MRTEIRTHGDLVVMDIVFSRENLERLRVDGLLSNGVVRMDGELLVPFAQAHVNVAVEDDAAHYDHPDREAAKQLVRDLRSK